MAIFFPEFLANAVKRVLPVAQGPNPGSDVLADMQLVIPMTQQMNRIEWESLTVTAAIAAKPKFTLPVVPEDEVHIYRIVSVRLTTGAVSNKQWFINVTYPTFPEEVTMVRARQEESDASNLLAADENEPDDPAMRTLRYEPLKIYPSGIMQICREDAVAIADVIEISLLREVTGGPLRAETNSTMVASGLI